VKRIWACIPLVSLLLSGCRIEATPREYFDHVLPIEAERAEASDEITSRIRAFSRALGTRDTEGALRTLAPANELHLIGPTAGEIRIGVDQTRAIIERIAGLGAIAIELHDVEVWVGPRSRVAWFAALFHVPGAQAVPEWRMTGVYVRQEGTWQLVQAHLSAATSLALPERYPPAAEAPAADE
jgi:hypothetical protein